MPKDFDFLSMALTSLAKYPEFFIVGVIAICLTFIFRRRSQHRAKAHATPNNTPMFNKAINLLGVVVILLIVSGSARSIIWELLKFRCK